MKKILFNIAYKLRMYKLAFNISPSLYLFERGKVVSKINWELVKNRMNDLEEQVKENSKQ